MQKDYSLQQKNKLITLLIFSYKFYSILLIVKFYGYLIWLLERTVNKLSRITTYETGKDLFSIRSLAAICLTSWFWHQCALKRLGLGFCSRSWTHNCANFKLLSNRWLFWLQIMGLPVGWAKWKKAVYASYTPPTRIAASPTHRKNTCLGICQQNDTKRCDEWWGSSPSMTN